MAARIFLLPGFGENNTVYDPLLPYLTDYEVRKVDYPEILSQVSLFNYSGMEIVKIMIRHYRIQPEDKLIGHSTGGYFAFLIREIQGNEICMISGFSDCKKVIPPLPHQWITTPLLSITGFIKSPISRKYMLNKVKGKPIVRPLMEVMGHFKDFTNEELFKLSMVLTYDEKPISILPNPLRIHAKDDKVVRIPDQEFAEVKGGHFPLALDLEGVVMAMKDFLKKDR